MPPQVKGRRSRDTKVPAPLIRSSQPSLVRPTSALWIVAQLFDPKSGFLQLVPSAPTGMEGHDLGYLLWGCVETDDWRKEQVYHALVNGPTVDAWGSFYEAYFNEGQPAGGDRDLRSLETGVNLSALAKYWDLGSSK
jgi:hypothetical protein